MIEELEKCGMHDIAEKLRVATERYGKIPNDGSFGKGNKEVAAAWKAFRKSRLPKDARRIISLQRRHIFLGYLYIIFFFLFCLLFLAIIPYFFL